VTAVATAFLRAKCSIHSPAFEITVVRADVLVGALERGEFLDFLTARESG